MKYVKWNLHEQIFLIEKDQIVEIVAWENDTQWRQTKFSRRC